MTPWEAKIPSSEEKKGTPDWRLPPTLCISEQTSCCNHKCLWAFSLIMRDMGRNFLKSLWKRALQMYMCTYRYHYLLKLLAKNNSTNILHQREMLMTKETFSRHSTSVSEVEADQNFRRHFAPENKRLTQASGYTVRLVYNGPSWEMARWPQIIVVAKKYIYVSQLFISRMPKMRAIPQLVSAPLYTWWPLYTGQLCRKYKATENFGKLPSDW